MNTRSLSIRAALILLTACAGSGGGAAGETGNGELLVEVYSGFTSTAPALAPAPAHLVVDVSAMLPAGGVEVPDDDQRRLARSLIVPYLARRPGPGLESAALHVFQRSGPASGEPCSDPASGASLAASQALERLRDELAQGDIAYHARVVLFSDFASECAPRLCEAAARLVERGAWLELAAIGSDAGVPECLASLRPSAQAPISWLAGWSPAKPPTFTVEAVTATDGASPVLAQGAAGTPIQVAAGLRRIRVALDPPEIVGPIRVRPDQQLRIRILDFPLSAPGERVWQVEAGDAKR